MKKIICILALMCLPLVTITAQEKIHYLKTGMQQTLEDGLLYRIPFDSIVLDFHESRDAVPISIAPDATAAIELRYGQKLVVCGSNAQNIMLDSVIYAQACPGILIPPTSTLIVFGSGEIIAMGGNATSGMLGQNGGSAFLDGFYAKGGYGGYGGAGGAGGAPGIGGRGGLGGTSTPTVMPEIKENPNLDHTYYYSPIPGVNGRDGTDGEDMGALILLGDINVTAMAGKGGDIIRRYATHGANDNYRQRTFVLSCAFRAGYGGGGGNGGSGSRSLYDIGGGAPGAGGGGSGSAGGFMSKKAKDYDELQYITGEGGKGGVACDSILSGRHGEGLQYEKGKSGGDKGKPGKRGDNGYLQFTPYAKLNFTFDSLSYDIVESLDDLPEDLLWMFERKLVGAEWVSDDEETTETEISMYYGQQMTELSVLPLDANNEFGHFLGYSDQYGKKVYDRDGKLALDTLDHSRNFAYNDKEDVWIVVCPDSVVLMPLWSGMRNIYVTRYKEDPNLFDSKTGIKRYKDSDLYNYEYFSLPVGYDGKTIEINIYKDSEGNVVVDKNKYLYNKDPEAETITIEVPRAGEAVIVQLDFDAVRHTLTWEGLDEELMSRLCTNITDYTHADSIPVGRLINYPIFRQAEGKAFDHWEVRSADGTYTTFDEELMPDMDIILRPVFRTATFNADVRQTEGATVMMDMTSSIPYHSKVTGVVHCNESFRCNEVNAYGAESMNIVEVEYKDSTFTFTMPDEDVVVKADIEYHPFCVLSVIKATETETKIDSIVYYATKDWTTFYTDDNDYYKFNKESFGGPISNMTYTVGDNISIHTDFRSDDGARQGRVFVIRNLGEEDVIMDEVDMSLRGKGEDAISFFSFSVDSMMTKTDIPVQILWTSPRYKFHIETNNPEDARIVSVSANGRNISDSYVAYMDEQVSFRVETTDTTFNHANILLQYEDGYDWITIAAGTYSEEGDSLEYTFIMPEGDVRLTLATGTKYSILSEISDKGYSILAPTAAVAGYEVPCIIEYYTDKCEVSDSQYLYINGERYGEVVDIDSDKSSVAMSGMSQYVWDEGESKVRRRVITFVMPEEDTYISLGGNSDSQGITTVEMSNKHREDNTYNILGQKISGTGRNNLPEGFYINNGKKQYIVK